MRAPLRAVVPLMHALLFTLGVAVLGFTGFVQRLCDVWEF